MAISLQFVLNKYLRLSQPNRERPYLLLAGKNLLPGVELGQGEDVLCSVRTSRATFVFTNERFVNCDARGLSWAVWWQLKDLSIPRPVLICCGETEGLYPVQPVLRFVDKTVSLSFIDGTVMTFEDCPPDELDFWQLMLMVLSWLVAQKKVPGRTARDVGIRDTGEW